MKIIIATKNLSKFKEIKDILRAYMRAILPWIDNPTDQAIHSILYQIAKREKIKYILLLVNS